MPKIKYGIPRVTKKLDSNYVPYPKPILGAHSPFSCIKSQIITFIIYIIGEFHKSFAISE